MRTERKASLSGPKGQFIVGCLYEYRRDPLGFTARCARDYGDFVPIPFLNQTAYLLSDPLLIEEVLVAQHRRFIKPEILRTSSLQRVMGNGLVSSDGDFWARQRRLIQPTFHRERISHYADIMVQETREMLSQWRAGEEINVPAAMSRLTLKVVVRTLFGSSISQEEQDTVATCVASLLDLYGDSLSLMGILSLVLVTEQRWRLFRASNQLDDIIYRILDDRSGKRSDLGDLFSMLQNTKDERGLSMSKDELRDEVMTLFLAGHETTATALSWTWMLLSQNSDVARKLEAEIDRVLGDRVATLADLAELKYAESVIKESMRMFPPIWSIARQSTEVVTLGGYEIPANTNVIMSQWVVHRDSRFFEHPLKFRPERWSESQLGVLPKYAYFPFGGGPRVCIGNVFAMSEAVLILSTVLQRYRLALVQEIPMPLATMTLRPWELKMQIESRRKVSVKRKGGSDKQPSATITSAALPAIMATRNS
jgi:cytochrome P450